MARKFAAKEYSLNIFILSMCRLNLDKDVLQKINGD